jgi:integrase
MIVRVSGVKKVRNAKSGRVYYYHRRTGLRLQSASNTAAFIDEVKQLDKQPLAKPEKERGTWGALVTAYRGSPEYKQLADRTRGDYEKVFDWLAGLDGMPIIQMDGPFLIASRDRAFETKKRRFTNHVMQVIGTVMGWGKPRKLSLGYPLRGEKRIKIARPRDLPRANRPWTEEECVVVLSEAEGGLQLGIGLSMFAAMRGEDVVVVPWTIYNGQALKWKQKKTGDIVSMDGDRVLCRLLDSAPRKAVTIVTGALGRPLTEAGYRKAFRTLILRLLKEEKVAPGLTIHGLRHTNGDMLADLGADPRMIQALLGQRSMAAALHYSQGADRRRAASAAVHLLERGRTKLARALGKSGGKSAGGER